MAGSNKLNTSIWWICFIYKHTVFHFTRGWLMDWSLVDYCDFFISCLDSHSDGTHSLHWWASAIASSKFSKFVPDEETNVSASWMVQFSANEFLTELFLLIATVTSHDFHKKKINKENQSMILSATVRSFRKTNFPFEHWTCDLLPLLVY